MRVLAYSPDAPTESHKIMQCFVKGLERYGHHTAWRAIQHYREWELSDLVVTVGWTAIANRIHKDQIAKGRPSLAISDGYIRKGTGPGAYYAISRNGFGAYGEQPAGCSDDRWKMVGVELKKWRKSKLDDPILIGHQHTKTHQGTDRQAWFERALDYLLKNTDRKIIVRGHPRDPKFILPHGCEAATGTLDEDLENCHCVVTYDSNIVVEALIAGVPCFTAGKTMGDPLCINQSTLAQIEKPTLPSRDEQQQWANNLAYSQWTTAEMANGDPFLFLTRSVATAKTALTPDTEEKKELETPEIDPQAIKERAEKFIPNPLADDTPAEKSPEELAATVDKDRPEKADKKSLLAWILTNTGECPATNTPKAHLVSRVLQLTKSPVTSEV